ncbi:MAG: tetratricopeptide repeat protein [Nitrospirota bacterium]
MKKVCLFFYCLIGILSIFFCLTSVPVSEAVEGISSEHIKQIDKRIERLKEDILKFNKDILGKEFFNDSNLIIFLSLEIIHPFRLIKAEIKIDGNLIQEYKYSEKEQDALTQGGSQILFIGKVAEGEHTLAINYHGIEHNKRLISEDRIRFEKRSIAKYIEITIRDQDKKPHLLLGVMDFSTAIDTMDKMIYKVVKYYQELDDYLNAATILLLNIQRETDINKKGELKLLLGKLYTDWRFYSYAMKVYKGIIHEFPPNRQIYSNSWFFIGKLYYNLGDFNNALSSFSNIITDRIDPSLLYESWYLKGNIRNHLQEYLAAVDMLSNIPEESQYYPFALYSMGLSYLNIGDNYSAVLNFKKITDLKNKRDEITRNLIEKTHLTLGYLFLEQNRYKKALTEFNAIPVDSSFFDQSLFGIGWSFVKEGEFIKALVSFKDLVGKYPNSPYTTESISVIGYCYVKLNSYYNANESYYNALTFYTDKIKELESVIDNIDKDIQSGAIFVLKDFHDEEIGMKNWLLYRIQQKKDIIDDINRYEEIFFFEDFFKEIVTDLLNKKWNKWKILFLEKDRLQNISVIRGKLKEARNLRKISFNIMERSLIEELRNIKERLEDFSVETTIRIAINMVKGNTDLRR